MFSFLEQEQERRKIERERSEIIGNILEAMAQSVVSNPDTDEEIRLSFLILFKAESLENAIRTCIVEKYAAPDSEANRETLKDVLDYLTFVELGIKQFSETTPIVKNEND